MTGMSPDIFQVKTGTRPQCFLDACARGQLLLLAPWQHHNEQTTISRQQCLSLNDMARMICMQ